MCNQPVLPRVLPRVLPLPVFTRVYHVFYHSPFGIGRPACPGIEEKPGSDSEGPPPLGDPEGRPLYDIGLVKI